MKKLMLTIAATMTVLTVLSAIVLGVWSSWYPWPPPKDGSAGDVQNAIWLTWIWAVLFPTVVIDLGTMALGDFKKWWK